MTNFKMNNEHAIFFDGRNILVFIQTKSTLIDFEIIALGLLQEICVEFFLRGVYFQGVLFKILSNMLSKISRMLWYKALK